MAAKKATGKKKAPKLRLKRRLIHARSSSELRRFWRIADNAYRFAERFIARDDGATMQRIVADSVTLAASIEVALDEIRPDAD